MYKKCDFFSLSKKNGGMGMGREKFDESNQTNKLRKVIIHVLYSSIEYIWVQGKTYLFLFLYIYKGLGSASNIDMGTIA